MRQERSVWIALPLLLAAVAAEEPRDRPLGGIERLARGLQKKVHCAGLSAFECVQCLSPGSMASLVAGNDTNETVGDRQRERLSVLLLERLTDMRQPCNVGRCGTYEQCRAALQLASPGRLARLEDILRRVKAVYVPTNRHKCFTAEDVLNSLVPYEQNEEAYVEKVATSVITHLSQGHCIEVGDAVTDFLEDLFRRYGDNTSELMTQQGLERLLKKLRLASEDIAYGHKHKHDHGDGHHHSDHDHDYDHDHESHNHDHDYEHEDGHDNNHDNDHGSENDHDHKHDHGYDHEHNHDHEHDHGHDHEHDHDDGHGHIEDNHHGHSGHNHHSSNTTVEQTSTPPVSSTSTDSHTHSTTDYTETSHERAAKTSDHHHQDGHIDHDGHEHDDEASTRNRRATVRPSRSQPAVQPGSNVVGRRRRGVPPVPDHDIHNHNSSASKCWTPRELIRQFGFSGNGTISRREFFHLCPALIQQAVSDVCLQTTREEHKPTTAELYGYGTLSVFIISLCSLMGVLLLPCLARHAYYYIMMGFIGLSFGTMTGDAFLHLIPQVLGLHSHDSDHGSEGHSHSHGHDHDSLVPEYMWKQLGLIGALYGLFIFEALSNIFSGEKSDGHGHSHLPKNIPEDLHMTKVSSKTESNIELAHCSSTPSLALEENPQVPVLKSRALCCGMSTLATMVIIGGAIHNVADGLAIGAAFSSGLKSGLSTSLAVFCHELPHEFGDFVVLISTGLGYRRALLLNFLSAMAAFAGLYAGFLLGEEVAARDWILTVTAGIFLYVALVDMLPELKQYKGKSPFKMFIVKNIGVLAGVGIMCVIAIYEDQLNI
ncbi:zinc transporter ZIP10 [Rhipicephalus sanguineus]|uniref:zinc transporter ZIP10 n=1 Tax=Rhipicephalus sanguineus TaxID=34632 RepID=UPI001894F4B1|nr:zinc transporter ZIP10 [Rhipicephalus sanguineus]XP_037516371.1 zinc transporter ZIP10 [Rhipicephalus sanguineus]XP_037516372.1 zinc transporter ZIP10 [Rhipicephalus sanguineus]XP_049272203.1 zinc transporter ZIP10 [Rhipicephalus sanguineus]XP_049272204.1 zinc transporter ZIP10 [Rhipicephalus sanguineus]